MKILNATNHRLAFYLDENKLSTTRKGIHVLEDKHAKPSYVIKRQKAYSLHPTMLCQLAEHPKIGKIYLPELYDTFVDPLPDNYWQYDIIVCSKLYVNLALHAYAGNWDILDRLYTTVPVFEQDPEQFSDLKVIGTAGLRKAIPPLTPKAYIQLIRNGYLPSRVGVEASLNSIIQANVPLTYEATSDVRELQNYLRNL